MLTRHSALPDHVDDVTHVSDVTEVTSLTSYVKMCFPKKKHKSSFPKCAALLLPAHFCAATPVLILSEGCIELEATVLP